jgi:hypothetical protein
VVATLVFWIYFYFSPKNKVSEKIKSRLSYSGRYRDSQNQQIDVYEDEFTADALAPIDVSIPPFETAPEVTIFRKDGKRSAHSPSVSQVTPDGVRFSVATTAAYGTYGFRARGKRLSPASSGAAPGH